VTLTTTHGNLRRRIARSRGSDVWLALPLVAMTHDRGIWSIEHRHSPQSIRGPSSSRPKIVQLDFPFAEGAIEKSPYLGCFDDLIVVSSCEAAGHPSLALSMFRLMTEPAVSRLALPVSRPLPVSLATARYGRPKSQHPVRADDAPALD